MSWTKVISKRSGFRWDVFPFGGANLRVNESVITSFYISEFPDYFNSKRLFEIFGCSGDVVEVAISPRRNSFGKRFAFARFRNVEDGRLLAIRLDNVQIEGKKIHANLPRFDRVRKVSAAYHLAGTLKRPGGHSNFKAGAVNNSIKFIDGGQSGRKGSYAAALSKGQFSVDGSIVNSLFEFKSDEAVKRRLLKSYVGRVCLPGSAYNIQNYLEMEGIFAIKATPIGSNCCLLEELEDGFIGDLIREGETWWQSLFSTIEKWEVGALDGCRDVWIRIFGVPLHAWSPEFFVAIGEYWGRFVCLDEFTSKGESLDVARILVNVPISLHIPEVVTVKIDGMLHNLCVREEAHSLYRHSSGGSGNTKFQPSSDVSSGSSESDYERMMVESSAGCSIDGEEKEAKVGFDTNSNSGESAVKVIAHPDSPSARRVYDGLVDGNKGESKARSVVDSIGKNSRLEVGGLKAVSGTELCGAVADYPKTSDVVVGIPNFLELSSSSTFAGHDKLFSKAVEGDVRSVKAHPVQLNSSSSDGLSAVPLLNREVQSVCSSAAGLGNNIDIEAGPGSVGIIDSYPGNSSEAKFNFGDRISDEDPAGSKVGQSDFENTGQSGGSTNSSLDTVLGSLLVGDLSRAAMNNGTGASDIPSLDRSVFSKNCPDVAPAAGCSGPAVQSYAHNAPPRPESGFGLQCDGRCDRKFLRKAPVGQVQINGGKNSLKNKSSSLGRSKGVNTAEYSRDSTLRCYGEQSEESDIARNNGRNWDMLKREVGDRLWEAMNALGVVDRAGLHVHHQGADLLSVGRKDNIDLSR